MSWMVPLEWKGASMVASAGAIHGFIGTNRFLSRLHGISVTFRPDMASYGNATPAMLHAMVRVKPAPMRQPDIFPIDELSGVRASSMP